MHLCHLCAGLNELRCVHISGAGRPALAAVGRLHHVASLGTSSRLLVEAHEALNAWHDGFIFDGVCDTLAQMAVEADAPGPTGPTKA